jgi:hypothetical protein
MTMTIDEDRIGHPLNIRGGIFEFVPAGGDTLAHTKTLSFDELETGASYEMIVTTLGGLYRYAIGDIFRVSGFVDEVPRLEYVGRRAVSDLTGEKLADEQVFDVVRKVLKKFGAASASFTLCGVREDDTNTRPRYVLVLEPDAAWRREVGTELARDLDAELKAANSRYELKRNFNDLGSVEVETVTRGTFARYREALIQRGMPGGQLKDKVLHAEGRPVLAELVALSRSDREPGREK